MKKFIKKAISRLGYKIESNYNSDRKENVSINEETAKNRFEPYEYEFLGKKIYIHDYASFELGKSELFKDNIYKFNAENDEPYIIDCGANLGMSLIYFKSLYPKAKIVAFEADPHIYSFLEKNVKSYGFEDVNVINKAVWDSNDIVLSFLTEGGAGGRLQNKSEDHTFVDVKTIRLKDYLNRSVDFLKIDIEGAEYKVIKDCAEHLKNVRVLFIEYHSFPETEQNLHSILEIVQNAGFRYHLKEAFTSSEPFVEQIINFGMDLQLNIFCYRT